MIEAVSGDATGGCQPTAGTESVMRDIVESAAAIKHLVHDFKRVLTINESACRLFYELLRKLSDLGKPVVFTQVDRLATFSPSMVFGEIAMLDHAPRTATIVADSEIICGVLNRANFKQLGTTHPGIKIKLLKNLSLCLCRRLRERKLSVLE